MATEEDPSPTVMTWMHQAFCGLHGHDSYLQFEEDRMFLKCVSCGHESHGWELSEPRPAVKLRGDARRHVLQHPQFIGARRVA